MPDSTVPAEEEIVERKPWQPLEFEKIAIADAESGITGTGGDNTIYS
jgi:hypothetical protein